VTYELYYQARPREGVLEYACVYLQPRSPVRLANCAHPLVVNSAPRLVFVLKAVAE
jgi:hypothetical protein